MKKTIFLSILVFVAGSFFLFNAKQAGAVKPSDYGLKEGDLISAIFSDDPDVYIINDFGYKRLFLNPEIFKFYGHLGGFFNVRLVTPEVRDSFITSGLFRNCEDNDQKVYGVDIEGEDTGQLHWVNSSGERAVKDDPDFFKKVFCINSKEFNWYPKGNTLNTVKEVPKYERMETRETIPTEKKLETNIPLKEEGKVVVCHYPPEAPGKFQEITIDASALKAHLEHGDSVGLCPGTVSIPKPTCSPRPACLDATPRCLLSEPIGGWCPTYTPTPIPTQGYISVVSPNGGETWPKGVTRLIKWNSANISKIYIKLRKGNDTYPGPEGMITDVILNVDGYYKWTIPTTLPDGNDYSVRIIDGNLTGLLDDSDAPFSIVTSPGNQTSSITVLSPNGGEQWQSGNYYAVKWTNTTGKSVNLELMKGNNVVAGWSPISSAVSVHDIGLPLPLETGSDYRIRITTVDSSNVDSSDAPFSIVSTATQTPVPTPMPATSPAVKSLRLISPNGGEQWTIGPEYTIRWENSGVESVTVELYKGGVYLAGLGGLGGGIPTSWTWNTINTSGFASGSDFKIRIKSGQRYGPTSETGIYDESDNNFSMSVTLPSPTTCSYLKSYSATNYYFGQCSIGGFDNVCFDKLYSTYQGCTRNTNNDCTASNAHASQNILCPVSNAPNPTPTPTPTPTTPALTPAPTLTPTLTPTPTPTSTSTSVKKPDLIITDLTWSTPVSPNQSFLMTITVKNIGEAEKIYNDVVYAIDTPLTSARCIHGGFWSSLVPGESISRTFTFGFCTELEKTNYGLPAGTYEIQAIIDYDNVFDESNETNNTLTKTLMVGSSAFQSNFSRNLTIGSTGHDVKQLQALLVNEVNYPANLITGYFGSITREAVKRLQEKYGIKPVYGYFGEITRKALNALIPGQ